MTWNDHGVPMGIVGSPLLFSEIVPEVDSKKRFARAEVVARVRSVKKKRAVFAGRVIVAMKGPDIRVGWYEVTGISALRHFLLCRHPHCAIEAQGAAVE